VREWARDTGWLDGRMMSRRIREAIAVDPEMDDRAGRLYYERTGAGGSGRALEAI